MTSSAPDSFTESPIWFPFSYHADLASFPPIVIERGEGVYLHDVHGKRYIDGVGSWWTSVLGHNHPAVMQAIRDQTGKLDHVMMAGFVSPPALELADLIAGILPAGMGKIFYSDNGSTSVEVALKIALQYFQIAGDCSRTQFISLGDGYHGDTLGTMAVGSVPAFHDLFHKLFADTLHTDPPNCYRCPASKSSDNCTAECMDSLEKLFAEHAGTVAAVIVEPLVQGAAGMHIYPPKVLSKIASLAKKNGALLIADEVATGFGRTGTMWAVEQAGVTPDILCAAKGLTGGSLPMAFTAVTPAVYAAFAGEWGSDRILNHGHTFTGNPITSAAGCAALKLFKELDLPRSASKRMQYFREGLGERFLYNPDVGDVRSIGMVGAVELVKNRVTKEALPKEKRLAHRIYREALHRGLIMRPLGDVLYFVPSLLMSEPEIDTMLDIALESVVEVMGM